MRFKTLEFFIYERYTKISWAKKINPLKFISMQSEIINKWYYKPDNKWFDNRKEAKIYLGGDNKFNKALKNMEIIYVNFPEK